MTADAAVRPRAAPRAVPPGLPVLAAVAVLVLALGAVLGHSGLTIVVAVLQVLLVVGCFTAGGHPEAVAAQLLAVLAALVADGLLQRSGSGWGAPAGVLGLALPVAFAVLLAGPDRTRVAERLTLTVAATATSVALAVAIILARRSAGADALLAGLLAAAVALLALALLRRSAVAAAVVAVGAGAAVGAAWLAAGSGSGIGSGRGAVVGAVAALAALTGAGGTAHGLASPPLRRTRPRAAVLLAAVLPVPLVTAGTAVAYALLH